MIDQINDQLVRAGSPPGARLQGIKQGCARQGAIDLITAIPVASRYGKALSIRMRFPALDGCATSARHIRPKLGLLDNRIAKIIAATGKRSGSCHWPQAAPVWSMLFPRSMCQGCMIIKVSNTPGIRLAGDQGARSDCIAQAGWSWRYYSAVGWS